MKNKLIIAVLLFSLIAFPVSAGKIADYTYVDGESNIIVANRNANKKIALTFDDGPCRLYTEEILKILEENNAKATFFIIGKNAEENPDMVKKTYSAGHEIGNHTYSHRNLRKHSIDEIDVEIAKTQKIIKDITGESPTLFRPPGGYINNDIVNTITINNCKTVLWSWRQDTKDWQKPSSESIVKNVMKNLNDGDIILFHDYNTKGSPTPDALRILLPKLAAQGYEFVTVSQLIRE